MDGCEGILQNQAFRGQGSSITCQHGGMGGKVVGPSYLPSRLNYCSALRRRVRFIAAHSYELPYLAIAIVAVEPKFSILLEISPLLPACMRVATVTQNVTTARTIVSTLKRWKISCAGLVWYVG